MTVFGLGDLAFMGAVGGVAAYDADAQAYITAVETADGQVLETAVKDAINDFVVGCKADGIWTAIKASCIMAGARTLAGALVPLVGAAPTNVGGLFVSDDYNRKTGLKGNGSSKYLNGNILQNNSNQNNAHFSAYVSSSDSRFAGSFAGVYLGSRDTAQASRLGAGAFNSDLYFSLNGGPINAGAPANQVGFMGATRTASSQILVRRGSATTAYSSTSVAPAAVNVFIFANNRQGVTDAYTDARLAFYSIGESLDLALLDARVTTLINAFAAAIP